MNTSETRLPQMPCCHVCQAPAIYSETNPHDRKKKRYSCRAHPPEHVRRFCDLAWRRMLIAARCGRGSIISSEPCRPARSAGRPAAISPLPRRPGP